MFAYLKLVWLMLDMHCYIDFTVLVMDFMFFIPVDGNVELPHFTLCKWASSDDPEKSSEEAKSKDDEVSPAKPERPQSQHEGMS